MFSIFLEHLEHLKHLNHLKHLKQIETIGNIETFKDKFRQLEVTGLVKPGKGLAQFCQTMFRQMKLAK